MVKMNKFFTVLKNNRNPFRHFESAGNLKLIGYAEENIYWKKHEHKIFDLKDKERKKNNSRDKIEKRTACAENLFTERRITDIADH